MVLLKFIVTDKFSSNLSHNPFLLQSEELVLSSLHVYTKPSLPMEVHEKEREILFVPPLQIYTRWELQRMQCFAVYVVEKKNTIMY